MRKSKIKNYWITPEMVMSWDPCKPRWCEGNVLDWFNGRKRVRFKTILKDESIPYLDRDWIVESIYVGIPETPEDWWTMKHDVTLEEIIAKIE